MLPESVLDRKPWYHEGLQFSCTQCGNCCTGTPGYVWVDEPTIARLAEFLGIDPDAFSRQYVRRVGDRLSLIERGNGDCIFWKRDAGCTVYPARPIQCRTWPFWWQNLASPESWERTCDVCPGSGQGRLYSVEEIQDALRRDD
jgi:Fe-S-cluster containining protein